MTFSKSVRLSVSVTLILAAFGCGKKKSSSTEDSPAAVLDVGSTLPPGLLTTKNLDSKQNIIAVGTAGDTSSLTLDDQPATGTKLLAFTATADSKGENLLTDQVEAVEGVATTTSGVIVSVKLKNASAANRRKTIFFPRDSSTPLVNGAPGAPIGEDKDGVIYGLGGYYFDWKANKVGDLGFANGTKDSIVAQVMLGGVIFVKNDTKQVCFFYDTSSKKRMPVSCSLTWATISDSKVFMTRSTNNTADSDSYIVNIADGTKIKADVQAPNPEVKSHLNIDNVLYMISILCPGPLVNYTGVARFCSVNAADGKATTLLDEVYAEEDTLLSLGKTFIIKSLDKVVQVSPKAATSLDDTITATYESKVLLNEAVTEIQISGNLMIYTDYDGNVGAIDLTTLEKKTLDAGGEKVTHIFPVAH